MTPRLTIVVPAFNEAHRLTAGMERFAAAVDDGAVDLDVTEVVFIDDGSTDDTADTARRLLAPVPHHRVISLPTNRGKGEAIRTGVALARGSCTAYMDADMAIDPRAVPLLLGGLETSDIAIGSRALPDSMVDGTYTVRAAMGRLFNRLVTTGTGLGLQDTQCGFKAFPTPTARLLFHLVRIDRFAFDVELLARARRLGLRITEVPVQWKNVPGSTIHPLHDSITMLADVYRSRLGLLATPPVPAVVVRGPSAGDREALPHDRIADVVADTLTGAPVPVVPGESGGRSVTVLLPLVGPAEVAMVLAALRAEFHTLDISRRAMDLDALGGLGPLSGRLRPASDPTGMG
jgi:dolichyl-phosphate beta-glucosyltransferase